MKIFKFTGGGSGPIDIYYLTEHLKLTESFDYEIKYISYLNEYLIFKALGGSRYIYDLTETFNLRDAISFLEALIELFSLSDLEERWGWGYFDDSVQLEDICSPRMVYSITLNENIALADSGTYNLANVDYKITWRSRTREPGIGYGKAGYGIVANYGEGDCIDLKEFKVRVYVMPAHTLKRTATITIVDTQNPDDDAEYIYTSAFNIADNITFKSNLRFEVTQVNQSDVESPVAFIDVEPLPV